MDKFTSLYYTWLSELEKIEKEIDEINDHYNSQELSGRKYELEKCMSDLSDLILRLEN